MNKSKMTFFLAAALLSQTVNAGKVVIPKEVGMSTALDGISELPKMALTSMLELRASALHRQRLGGVVFNEADAVGMISRDGTITFAHFDNKEGNMMLGNFRLVNPEIKAKETRIRSIRITGDNSRSVYVERTSNIEFRPDLKVSATNEETYTAVQDPKNQKRFYQGLTSEMTTYLNSSDQTLSHRFYRVDDSRRSFLLDVSERGLQSTSSVDLPESIPGQILNVSMAGVPIHNLHVVTTEGFSYSYTVKVKFGSNGKKELEVQPANQKPTKVDLKAYEMAVDIYKAVPSRASVAAESSARLDAMSGGNGAAQGTSAAAISPAGSK